ncbi:MAG: hypothetical protein JWO06_309 [Bacteroidota bacterium]|nr:hypothetical protein [Bacteroidota bacterium]
MNKLLIYTQRTSPRLTYILDFILGDLLGLTYDLTQDKNKFNEHTGAKFSYARAPIADEIWFESVELLFETTITLQPISYAERGKMLGFYQVSEKSHLPFDLLASSFLMLSLYNEYLPNKKDKYDRYRGSQSLNYKLGILEKPMINYYALGLKKILEARYPPLVFKENKFEYIATFDIDMAYSYREKGMRVNMGGFVRSLIMSDFGDIRNRYKVLFRGKRDPFDTFDYVFKVCKDAGAKTMFFFLLGNRSKLDKNISHHNENFRRLIKKVAEKTETGIHLSFVSHVSNELMQTEVQRLEEITGKKVTANRFHYLRFLAPISYLRLIKIGIKEDYSMGFPARLGFRAGTCTPFKYFDLVSNEATEFKIHPFAFMDTTLTHYNRLNPEESKEKILTLMKYVKEVGGPFVALWHNSSLTETGQWVGWRDIFETVARDAAAIMKQQQ